MLNRVDIYPQKEKEKRIGLLATCRHRKLWVVHKSSPSVFVPALV